VLASHVGDAAFAFVPIFRIHQSNFLAYGHLRFQHYERSVRAYRHGERFFLKRAVVCGFTANRDGNVSEDTFTSSIFRLRHLVLSPFVRHAQEKCLAHYCLNLVEDGKNHCESIGGVNLTLRSVANSICGLFVRVSLRRYTLHGREQCRAEGRGATYKPNGAAVGIRTGSGLLVPEEGVEPP